MKKTLAIIGLVLLMTGCHEKECKTCKVIIQEKGKETIEYEVVDCEDRLRTSFHGVEENGEIVYLEITMCE